MKRILSVLLALVMMFALATQATAEGVQEALLREQHDLTSQVAGEKRSEHPRLRGCRSPVPHVHDGRREGECLPQDEGGLHEGGKQQHDERLAHAG